MKEVIKMTIAELKQALKVFSDDTEIYIRNIDGIISAANQITLTNDDYDNTKWILIDNRKE